MTRRMLIVGVTGGIGAAVRREAERRGWECVGTSRRAGAAECQLDCSDRDGLELALMRLFAAEGPFAAVVYCVGECPVAQLSRLDAATLAATQLVNCDAFILLVKHFARPGVFAKEGAAALAVSSVSAQEGWPGGTAYCASKGALSAACRALSAELAPRNIRVMAIEPRHVRTDMFRRCAGRMGVPESSAMPPEELAKDILGRIEMDPGLSK
ncbi:MAG: SDR family oxidoreductase [Kiritimatiellae bacterium]|nr:SDR family oxidoreductase [Kiritimatiellia bacterium]